MSEGAKPKVLIVYYTLSKQSGRVAEAMAKALEARGCAVTNAMIEFTDERWVPKLSQFPMKRPFPQIASILPAQLRHKTGEIRTAEVQARNGRDGCEEGRRGRAPARERSVRMDIGAGRLGDPSLGGALDHLLARRRPKLPIDVSPMRFHRVR